MEKHRFQDQKFSSRLFLK
ncbi:hypothetical protein CGLO_18380 [Colletotrichum gloeosporioides Cg-14]|uniref:Uncharacterized protein n=1 Tax=Colletotrichum gloeosporioides (strain Cg-14) TaxID=1237896 RepID=T0JRS7_COLGC|nr:hypothetical protein CGLO_18380 [Colletotrichum gloeosporioides Cg-14]